jgi:hypothetical protein
MRVIRASDAREYGFALGGVLASLLQPAPGQARALHRWYERDHFYAGCMTGPGFFAGRRFVSTPALEARRIASPALPTADAVSYLALYWMERDQQDAAERWAVDRVLGLQEQGRMATDVERTRLHASFHDHRWSALRDEDGVPPELALDHPFAGVVVVLSLRPEDVTTEARDAWLLAHELPATLPGSATALCLSLVPRPLPEDSPVWVPPSEEDRRRHLELHFLERDPREAWPGSFAGLEERFAAAGMGEVQLAAGFVPTVPGTDRFAEDR